MSEQQSPSRAKFEAAKALISEKHYAEARVLLKTINHPMALDWLDKLDQLDPPIATSQSVSPTYQTNPKKTKLPPQRGGLLQGLGCLMFIAFLLLMIQACSVAQNSASNDTSVGGTACVAFVGLLIASLMLVAGGRRKRESQEEIKIAQEEMRHQEMIAAIRDNQRR